MRPKTQPIQPVDAPMMQPTQEQPSQEDDDPGDGSGPVVSEVVRLLHAYFESLGEKAVCSLDTMPVLQGLLAPSSSRQRLLPERRRMVVLGHGPHESLVS